jgi:hypothetical protein
MLSVQFMENIRHDQSGVVDARTPAMVRAADCCCSRRTARDMLRNVRGTGGCNEHVVAR